MKIKRNLDQEIAKRAKEISTEAYAMSVGELLSLYTREELNLHPEFQRFFRWTDHQKSRLIESLLLGIPIPPIFVSQDDEGKWDVIDGLQRLSTIFQLTGELKDEDGKRVPPLVLNRTKYLPSLEDKCWSKPGQSSHELSETAKLILKRARIDVKIVLNKSDPSSKYELFDRLNTGGSSATDQEVRNCIMVMIDKGFFEWFAELSRDKNFRETLPLTERQLQEKFDMELVARFLCLRQINLEAVKGITDLGPFLTDRISEMAQDNEFDRDTEKVAAFRKFSHEKNRVTGAPLVSVFEVLALGIGYYAHDGNALPTPEKVKTTHQSVWKENKFVNGTGSGVRATSRLPITIPLGRDLFKP